MSDTSDVSKNDSVETQEHSVNKDDEIESVSELETLQIQLEQEKEKTSSCEKKIQYLLGDFENLKKRSEIDIQNRVN